MGDPVITVENFSYSYKGSSKEVLSNLSFSVEAGECCGIVGPTESGKTTLCYAIVSILHHYFPGGTTSGKVITAGLDVASTTLEAMMGHVGILMQNVDHFLTGIKLTVEEEIGFSLENLGADRSSIITRTKTLMGELGISHLAGRDPLTLSGGEKQRVALASVLAPDPPILILDEPTTSLDPEGVRELLAILKRIKGRRTILFVENRLETLPGFIDSLLVLQSGTTVYRGKPEGYFRDKKCIQEMIGAPVWTEVSSNVLDQIQKQEQVLPYTYREALQLLTRAR